MFRELRKKRLEISQEDIQSILKDGEHGVLATVGEDEYPYATPISYVYFNNNVYFHSPLKGHKVDNMSNNPRVSLCVVENHGAIPDQFDVSYKSVILFGKVSEVQDHEKKEALVEILKKYSSAFMEKGIEHIEKASAATKVYKISIEHITGKGDNN